MSFNSLNEILNTLMSIDSAIAFVNNAFNSLNEIQLEMFKQLVLKRTCVTFNSLNEIHVERQHSFDMIPANSFNSLNEILNVGLNWCMKTMCTFNSLTEIP